MAATISSPLVQGAPPAVLILGQTASPGSFTTTVAWVLLPESLLGLDCNLAQRLADAPPRPRVRCAARGRTTGHMFGHSGPRELGKQK